MADIIERGVISNLSQNDLKLLWNQDPRANNYRLTNDYIARGETSTILFKNDVILQARIVVIEGQIVDIEARLDTIEGRLDVVEALAEDNKNRLDVVEPIVTSNTDRLDSLEPRVTQNETDIATNASDIAAINTPSGSGSPEASVIATRTQLYIDVSGGPDLWWNPVVGSDTGWVLVSSSG